MSFDALPASESYPGYGKIASYYNVTAIHEYMRSMSSRVAQRLLILVS